MSKRVFSVFVLVFLVVFPVQIMGLFADVEVHDHVLNYNDLVHAGLGQYPTLYSNYSNRFYCFWGTDKNGIAAHDYTHVYATSFDGVSWTNYTWLETDEAIDSIEFYGVEKYDFYLTPNGSRLYFVNLNDEDGRPYEVDYRVYNISESTGELQLWIEEINIAVPCAPATWTPEISINIVVDNETRPYIAFESIDPTLTSNNAVLLRGAYTNGSWISHTSRTQWHNDITGGAGASELFYMDLVNTGDGITSTGIGRGVGWLVHWDTSIGIGEALDTDFAINYYDGAGWDVDGIGGLGMEDAESQWERRTVWIAQVGNVSALVVQIEDLAAPDRKRLDMAFKEGKNAWQNRTTLSFTVPGDVIGDGSFWACVGIDNETDFVVAWWMIEPDGNETIWYRRGNALQIMWNATWAWQTGITEWQDATRPNVFNTYDLAGGFCGFLPYNVPMSICWEYDAADEIWHDYLFTDSNGELIFPAEHLNTTLYNSNGEVNDEWIFEGEVYDLVSYVDNATNFYVNTSDSRHQIEFHWNNETEQFWIDVDPNDQFTIGLAYSEFERIGSITRLLWRFIPDRNIIDYLNGTWGYFIENSDMNYNATGNLGFVTTIYNLGGFVTYDFLGNAGRITGGDSFEIYAENSTDGDSAYAETIFRKLQGVHLLYSIDVEDGACFDHHEQTGYIEMGIQFRYNQTWVDGWYYQLRFVNGAVDPAGTPGKAWMIPQVEWYSRSIGGTVTNPRDDLLSAYPETGDTASNPRTEIRFWADLWFNRMNASTVVGGRVNSYYFGMREGGSIFWGNWYPIMVNQTSSMYFDDLRLPDGNITDSLEIELVKFWVNVTKTGSGAAPGGDCDDHRWALRNFEILNWNIAPDRMQGQDTPIFVETKLIDMASTGFLQPLYKAISGIGTSIWMGALGFQKILWGAMDSFFAWAGFGQGFFSSLTAFLMMIPDLFSAMMQNMAIMIQSAILLVEDVFGMVTRMLPEFVLGIGWLADSILNYWTTLMNFFNGGLLPFNIIQDLQLGDWIRAMFAMLPTWEIMSIIFADDAGKKLKERADFYSMLFNGVINFVKGAISFMQQAIQTIMEMIPG